MKLNLGQSKEAENFLDLYMYGRTKGRRLSKKQSLFLKNHLQNLLVDESTIDNFFPKVGEPKDVISGDKEIHLEIGFGSGEHLVYKAERNSNAQFFGCDYYLNGIASTVIKIAEKQLSNVKLFHGDATQFLNKIPNFSLNEVYLLYPDPWPKVKHLKRRFISNVNLELLALKLRDNGDLKVVTDSDSYLSHIKSVILTSRASKHFYFESLDHSRPWKDWCTTKYEDKAKKAGRSSHYMVLTKINVK